MKVINKYIRTWYVILAMYLKDSKTQWLNMIDPFLIRTRATSNKYLGLKSEKIKVERLVFGLHY